MNDQEEQRLVHLAGYATLAMVLGTANWSMMGWLFALPLVAGTLGYAGWLAYGEIIARARGQLDTEPELASDGGEPRDRRSR